MKISRNRGFTRNWTIQTVFTKIAMIAGLPLSSLCLPGAPCTGCKMSGAYRWSKKRYFYGVLSVQKILTIGICPMRYDEPDMD